MIRTWLKTKQLKKENEKLKEELEIQKKKKEELEKEQERLEQRKCHLCSEHRHVGCWKESSLFSRELLGQGTGHKGVKGTFLGL